MTWVGKVCWHSFKWPQRLEGCGSKLVSEQLKPGMWSSPLPSSLGTEGMKLELRPQGPFGSRITCTPPCKPGATDPTSAKSLILSAMGKKQEFWPLARRGLQVDESTLQLWHHWQAPGAVPRHLYSGMSQGKSSRGAPRGCAGGCRGTDPNICIHKSLILKVFLSCYEETISSPHWHCNQTAWLAKMMHKNLQNIVFCILPKRRGQIWTI